MGLFPARLPHLVCLPIPPQAIAIAFYRVAVSGCSGNLRFALVSSVPIFWVAFVVTNSFAIFPEYAVYKLVIYSEATQADIRAQRAIPSDGDTLLSPSSCDRV